MTQPFKTVRIASVSIFCVATFGALAQEPPTPVAAEQRQELREAAAEASTLDEKKLGDIGVDFKAINRMAEFCDELDPCVRVIRKVVAQNLELLREPRKDGSYRYASFQRIEAGRVTKEIEIVKVQSEPTLDKIEVIGKHAYSVVIIAPQKRSLFSANEKVFVRDLSVEMTSTDGKVSTKEIPVNVWVKPADAHTVPLDDIAASARVTVNVGVEAGGKKAVATAALLQASLVDDPMNPYYAAVKRLNALAAIAAEKNVSRGQLKSVSEEAVLELPGEMEQMMKIREIDLKRLRQMAETGEATGAIAIGDATPDVVHELNKASKLLTGTVTEQEEGRAMLQTLIEKLSPPSPIPTPTSEAAIPPTR